MHGRKNPMHVPERNAASVFLSVTAGEPFKGLSSDASASETLVKTSFCLLRFIFVMYSRSNPLIKIRN